jgi:hypothetical protein
MDTLDTGEGDQEAGLASLVQVAPFLSGSLMALSNLVF